MDKCNSKDFLESARVYYSMHGTGMVYIYSYMEQKCIDCKQLPWLHNVFAAAKIQLFFIYFCKVFMEESSSSSSVVMSVEVALLCFAAESKSSYSY